MGPRRIQQSKVKRLKRGGKFYRTLLSSYFASQLAYTPRARLEPGRWSAGPGNANYSNSYGNLKNKMIIFALVNQLRTGYKGHHNLGVGRDIRPVSSTSTVPQRCTIGEHARKG